MNKLLIRITLCLVLLVSMGAITEEGLTQEPEFVLKLGATGNAGSIWDTLYSGFKNKVEEKSRGRVRVDLYLGSALGGEREFVEMVTQGMADISMVSNMVYSLFEPKWAILDLPFFLSTREEAFKFLDGEGGQLLADPLLPKGLRVLGYGDSNMRQVSNNKREIHTPEDLKGLKIRVPETPALVDWFRSVGAIPTVLPFPELFPALQQGVVDGQENGMIAAFMANLHEVQKFYTDTNHAFSCLPVVISEITWQKLPQDIRDIVVEATEEAIREERIAVAEYDKEVVQKLQDVGVKVTLLTPEERAAFEATAKPIWQKYASQLGEDFMDEAFGVVGKEWR